MEKAPKNERTSKHKTTGSGTAVSPMIEPLVLIAPRSVSSPVVKLIELQPAGVRTQELSGLDCF
jgi:hypothetical protein